MQKTTKIIITLEAVTLAFLIAATVIAIINGDWFHTVCNILWIGIGTFMISQAVSNDKTLRAKNDLRTENFDLHEKVRNLKCDIEYLKYLKKREEDNEDTIRGYKDKFVELTEQMEKQHGATKEIRIKPYYHTHSVEIDF